MNGERAVEAGYDHMAADYLSTKGVADPTLIALLDRLVVGIPDGGRALDLGCGAGVPVTQWLARRFDVTGVDISARQLELARELVPAATLIKASMAGIDFAPASFDVVVACYSIIHVPREQQPALLDRIQRWLKPGGAFLATWALKAWEGTEENWGGWGAPMWWSHHDAGTNLRMICEAGFGIEAADQLSSGGETWLWVLARRPGV